MIDIHYAPPAGRRRRLASFEQSVRACCSDSPPTASQRIVLHAAPRTRRDAPRRRTSDHRELLAELRQRAPSRARACASGGRSCSTSRAATSARRSCSLGGSSAVLVEFPCGRTSGRDGGRADRIRSLGSRTGASRTPSATRGARSHVRAWRQAGAVIQTTPRCCSAAGRIDRVSRQRCSRRGWWTSSRATTTATRARSPPRVTWLLEVRRRRARASCSRRTNPARLLGGRADVPVPPLRRSSGASFTRFRELLFGR